MTAAGTGHMTTHPVFVDGCLECTEVAIAHDEARKRVEGADKPIIFQEIGMAEAAKNAARACADAARAAANAVTRDPSAEGARRLAEVVLWLSEAAQRFDRVGDKVLGRS